MKNTKKLKKMDKNLKSEWIKALLSGKYKQGFGSLKNHGKFCCLGVLADIQGILGKNLDKNNFSCLDGGLNGFFGKYRNRKAARTLIDMNDGVDTNYGEKPHARRSTFKEIADWIKKNL